MNDVKTAPTTKISIPTNKVSCEKTADKPRVKVSSATEAIPNPILELKSSRKSVEAMLQVRLTTVKLVCSFLRSKSFIGKEVSLIVTRQASHLQGKVSDPLSAKAACRELKQ